MREIGKEPHASGNSCIPMGALYYEMTDRIDLALHSLDLAEELATRHGKKSQDAIAIIDTDLLKKYREVLQNRKEELKKLEEL